jgi:hypothetical protein
MELKATDDSGEHARQVRPVGRRYGAVFQLQHEPAVHLLAEPLPVIADSRRERLMDHRVTIAEVQGTRDDREWELADEELDRSSENPKICLSCSTSRPCSCVRCHCR